MMGMRLWSVEVYNRHSSIRYAVRAPTPEEARGLALTAAVEDEGRSAGDDVRAEPLTVSGAAGVLGTLGPGPARGSWSP